MYLTFRSFLAAPAVLALMLTGCGPKDSDAGGTDGETDGETDGTDSNTGGTTTQTSAGTSTTGTATDTTATATASDSDTDSGGSTFITGGTDSGGSTGPLPPQPNGASCNSNDECESGFCYDVPMLGGTCSECLEDADCMMNDMPGTCALDFATGYAICTDGGLGSMCEKGADSCGDGLTCETLIDTGGFFPADFCSECGADGDCMNGQLCSPVYDGGAFNGYLGCVDPGSVPDGGGCDLDGSGDEACMNVCASVDIMGFLQLGVCGECKGDGDCMGQETCTPGTADMNGIMGSTCG